MISGLLLLMTIVVLVYRGGPNYGIDFTGGIFVQVLFQNEVKLESVRSTLKENGAKSFELQNSGNIVMIRTGKKFDPKEGFEEFVRSSIQSKFPDNPIKIERVEYVGSTVSKYLSKQAVCAFLFAFLSIVIYIALRFKSSSWGVIAVIGIIHDTIISFGFVALVNKEINITVIAALLTVAGYSVNDTIVLFDRIRENLILNAKENFSTIINRSISEVFVRTIITSLTVLIVACSIFFLGGEVIHTFAYIILIGTILGVFSTIFICAPLIYECKIRKDRRCIISSSKNSLKSK
jgi:preprotein translocase subunit SecF